MSTDKCTFSPGQLVLVRGGGSKVIDPRVWRVDMFSFQREEFGGVTYFFTGTGKYRECIPLEGHEFLAGLSCSFDDTPSEERPAVVKSPVTETAAIGSEVEALRAELRERDVAIAKLEAEAKDHAVHEDELLAQCADLEATRRSLEDDIVAFLSGEDMNIKNFLQRVMAENRVHREEREKLLEERGKLLATIEELRTGMRKYATN